MKLKLSLPHSWRVTSQWTELAATRYCQMIPPWCCALQFHWDGSHTILRGGILAWAVPPACWWLTGMKHKIEKYAASDSPLYLQTMSVRLQSLPWLSKPCLISHLSVHFHPSRGVQQCHHWLKPYLFPIWVSLPEKRIVPSSFLRRQGKPGPSAGVSHTT